MKQRTVSGHIRHSLTIYPVTVLYVMGSAVAVLIASANITLALGLLLLVVTAALLMVVGVWREVRVVHYLMEAQRTALLTRIGDLESALVDAGLPVPAKRGSFHDQ